MGSAAPAANGMAVRGTSAIETALRDVSYVCPCSSIPLCLLVFLQSGVGVAPLEAPVVAAVGRVRRRSRHGVIDTALDHLGKRREN